MRALRHAAIAIALLPVLLSACGKGDEAPTREDLFQLSLQVGREASGLLEEKRPQAAKETFLRAVDHALAALKKEGDLPPASIWNHLSYLCVELGRWSPGYLGRAVRYAARAEGAAPKWAMPWLNRADAYARAGQFEQARIAYERHRGLLSSVEPSTLAVRNQCLNLYNLGASYMAKRAHRTGAEGEARRAFDVAYAILPHELVVQGLTEINTQLAQAVNMAERMGDDLEMARVFARFGFPGPANEALNRARNNTGRTPEMRWVEARFVEELGGYALEDPKLARASLQAAARHYDELMARGERVVHAAAGYARVLRVLGRGSEALDRLGDFPEPSAELRVALIRLRVDIIGGLPLGEKEREREGFAKINELLMGGMEPADRAEILLSVASLAILREDQEETSRAIREFQRRFPRDARITILEAGLQELAGEPLEGADDGDRSPGGGG